LTADDADLRGSGRISNSLSSTKIREIRGDVATIQSGNLKSEISNLHSMSDPQLTCDPRRFEQCLGDSFTADERVAFELHLESCATCRQTLEDRAAAPNDWHAAKLFLSPDEPGDNATDPSDQDLAERRDYAAISGVLSALGPTDDPRMLGRLGGYEIAGVVGSGGMGVVLKGFDSALNRYVAIKVLAPHLAISGAARQRFAREARSAASVVHENVVAIHAVADSGPLPYFVMPYLRGASLQKRLDAHGPLGVPEILRVAHQIAAGLAAAHAQGLVHRDIKPANILLEDGIERLKITDFGLARAADDASLTRTGVIAGTPQFMSPEQARGEAVDPRSDLFSLGSVMYAMCVGHPPFRAETSYGILHRISNDTPRPIREINSDIPEWVAVFVERLHAKNPDDRFASSEEVARLLEQCIAHSQQPTAVALPEEVNALVAQQRAILPLPKGEGRGEGSPFPHRRYLLSIAATAIVLVALVGILKFSNLSNSPATLPSPLAGEGPGVKGQNSETAYQPESAWQDNIAPQLIESQAAIEQLETNTSEIPNPTFQVSNLQSEISNLKSEISNLEAVLSTDWTAEPTTNKPTQ
jgi:serine/threonine protein kinase